MMMVVLFFVVGAIVVGASYLSKWDVKKRMDKLRAEEAAFEEKVARFRAKEVEAMKDATNST